mgnify:CR=1 FL=1
MEQGVDDYILAKTESNQIKMDKGGLSDEFVKKIQDVSGNIDRGEE